MRVLVPALALLAFCGSALAQITTTQAAQDGKAVPVPNAASLVNPAKALEVVPQYNSSVQSQSDLFQSGKGQLVPPGAARTSDCANKTDPECIAVQLIVNGKNIRPSFTISPNDPLIQFRNTVVGDPLAILGQNTTGIVGNTQACSSVVKTVPPTYTTEVCDITIPVSETSCTQGLEVIVDPDYLYTCLQRLSSDQTATCSVGREIVVDATTLYKCIEQVQSVFTAACTVGRVITIDEDFNYQCDTRPYRINQYTCSRSLSVAGDPGCVQSQLYTAVASDPSGLGQDPCDGGDNLWLSYVCNPGAPPTLLIQTNTKSSGQYGFWLSSWNWDQEHYFENCKGRFYGNTACTNNNCVTNIVMEVSYGVFACTEYDIYGDCITWGNVWAYSGALGKTFNYLSWSLVNVQDQWNSTCTALEARSQ